MDAEGAGLADQKASRMWGGTDPQIDYLRLELPRQKRRASSNVNGYRGGFENEAKRYESDVQTVYSRSQDSARFVRVRVTISCRLKLSAVPWPTGRLMGTSLTRERRANAKYAERPRTRQRPRCSVPGGPWTPRPDLFAKRVTTC